MQVDRQIGKSPNSQFESNKTHLHPRTAKVVSLYPKTPIAAVPVRPWYTSSP